MQDDIAAGAGALAQGVVATLPGFHLYDPSRVHMPRKLRVFIGLMQPRLQAAGFVDSAAPRLTHAIALGAQS